MPGYADRHPWQAYGEPSGGGWTTVRASCTTTEIGVRLGCRPQTPSAALGNECGDPTHNRVAEFRLANRSSAFRACRPGHGRMHPAAQARAANGRCLEPRYRIESKPITSSASISSEIRIEPISATNPV